jgi:hypothetical protein
MKIDEGDSQISPDAASVKGGLLELLSTATFRGLYPNLQLDSRVDAHGATDVPSSSIKQEDETPEEPFQVREAILSDTDLTCHIHREHLGSSHQPALTRVQKEGQE